MCVCVCALMNAAAGWGSRTNTEVCVGPGLLDSSGLLTGRINTLYVVATFFSLPGSRPLQRLQLLPPWSMTAGLCLLQRALRGSTAGQHAAGWGFDVQSTLVQDVDLLWLNITLCSFFSPWSTSART